MNLLTNPGFETGDTTGWTLISGDPAVQSGVVRSGAYAGQGTGGNSNLNHFYQSISVTAGRWYTQSVWVRNSSGANDAGSYVEWHDSGGSMVGGWWNNFSAATTGWCQKTVSMVAPVGAVTAHCYLTSRTGDARTVYFDDAEFYETAAGSGTSIAEYLGVCRWDSGYEQNYDDGYDGTHGWIFYPTEDIYLIAHRLKPYYSSSYGMHLWNRDTEEMLYKITKSCTSGSWNEFPVTPIRLYADTEYIITENITPSGGGTYWKQWRGWSTPYDTRLFDEHIRWVARAYAYGDTDVYPWSQDGTPRLLGINDFRFVLASDWPTTGAGLHGLSGLSGLGGIA